MKVNAFRPSHRFRWLLLSHNILTKDELLLFEYYVDQMDFDINHRSSPLGSFKVDFKWLSKLFGYSPQHPYNSIRNKHKKLLSLGFIHQSEKRNTCIVHNPLIYVASSEKWKGKSQQFYKESCNKPLKEFIDQLADNVQLTELNIQPNEQIVRFSEQNDGVLLKKTAPRYLGSSKVKHLTPITKVKISQSKPLSYYEKLYQENDPYIGFLPEDMKWLDDHFDAEGRYLP